MIIQLNTQLTSDLLIISISGRYRSLAKITFTYRKQEYWIIMTPYEAALQKPRLVVDGYGDNIADLEFELERYHLTTLKKAFYDYQAAYN